MSKKILSLILAAVMIFGALAMTGCSLFEKNEQTETDDRLPTTLNLLGITESSTTPEAVAAVEEQINKILVAKYETKIKLTLVTEDEYYKLIEERIAEKKHLDNLDAAIQQDNNRMILDIDKLDEFSGEPLIRQHYNSLHQKDKQTDAMQEYLKAQKQHDEQQNKMMTEMMKTIAKQQEQNQQSKPGLLSRLFKRK